MSTPRDQKSTRAALRQIDAIAFSMDLYGVRISCRSEPGVVFLGAK